MKVGPTIIILGITMFVIGFILFYSIESNPSVDEVLRLVKHGGTFVGLMGIGVALAGILLHLMARGEAQVTEDFDI